MAAKASRLVYLSRLFAIVTTVACAAAASSAMAQIASFEGDWRNTDPTSRGIVRLEVTVRGDRVQVAAWGACTPEPCLIGRETAVAYASSVADDPVTSTEALTVEYTTGFSRNIVTLRRAGVGLAAESFTRFTDGSRRSAYVQRITFGRQEARLPERLPQVPRELPPVVLGPASAGTAVHDGDVAAVPSIQPDGSVRIVAPDGTITIKSEGSWTVTYPDGSATRLSFIQVPVIPPPATSATAAWFDFAAEVTVRTIGMLVEGDQQSLARLAALEEGLSVSEIVAKRIQTINWLLP